MSPVAKTVDLTHIARVLTRLPPNPRIVISGNAGTPQALIQVIDETLETATLNILNALVALPRREGIRLETAFVGAGMRGAPNLRYIPCRLSMLPLLFQLELAPDVVVIHTTTPRNGAVSLGVEVNVLPAAIEAARARGGIVIAAANPHMPFTHGDAVVDLDDIDYLVEIDEPIMTVAPSAPDAHALRIGAQISDHIHSGSTLQLGIGGVPDAVLLTATGLRDLRIWSETISDGVLALENAGALDPRTPVHTSFMLGSDDLYAWVSDNPRLSMIRTERCNDPGLIEKNYGMTSVNGALEVDLWGQVNASRRNGEIFSGIGGSTDFIIGAMHAPHGKAFIALPSWHPKAKVSTIVPQLSGPSTSAQPSAIVTEEGIAWLFGADQSEQAKNLIENAAHPASRPALREALAAR
jgi:acyl-CoA hydrolase